MRLIEYCELIVDCEHKTAPTQADGYPSIRTPNIGKGHFILDGVNRVSEETYRAWSKRAVPSPGDIIMAREAPVGNAAMIPPGLQPCLGQRTLLIRPNHSKVHAAYLAYLLVGPDVQATIHSKTNGVTVPHLNMHDVRELPLPALPSIAEQRRIAGILSAYDDLIENCERRIRVLDEMARALYREWFVLFRYPGHEKTTLVDSALGLIPKGWRAESLQDGLGAVQDGDWIETKDQGGEDYRLLQISNVGVGAFVETGNYRYVTAETFSRLRCNELTPGDILVARMPTPIGRAWLVTPQPWRMITAVDVAIVRTDPTRLLASYLVRAWNDDANLRRIAGQASGTTRLRITRRELAALLFVIPPMTLQTQFQSMVASGDTLTENLRARIKNLRKTRDLLLPRLLSGQLSLEAPA